jgi:hypothetical protein
VVQRGPLERARFEVRGELPAPVRVEAGDRVLPLLPLPDIVLAGPDVAGLVERLKAAAGVARAPSAMGVRRREPGDQVA